MIRLAGMDAYFQAFLLILPAVVMCVHRDPIIELTVWLWGEAFTCVRERTRLVACIECCY